LWSADSKASPPFDLRSFRPSNRVVLRAERR
jgi:hypothetical protein